jgi:hypothetical protein
MEAKRPLEFGDIVRLNSDTVRMMVAKVDGAKVVARWRDDELALVEADFDRRELVFVKSGAMS